MKTTQTRLGTLAGSRPAKLAVVFLSASWALGCIAPAQETAPAPVPDRFDYVLGTQNIAPAYHFTDETPLVEGARGIYDMGSNMLKLRLGPGHKQAGDVPPLDPKIKSLTSLVRDEPSYRQVLGMPFATYFMWTYCFSTDHQVMPWHGRMKPRVLAKEYAEIYDLTRYLLTAYNGTGKTFFLGNWEGDWHLLAGAPKLPEPWKETPNPDAAPGMIDWINTRQKAVDDAKRDTPHHDVQVYHYMEVNLVQKGIKGQVCAARDVLPHTDVDFVSYSSYDSLHPTRDIAANLTAALNYIEARLAPKPEITGKRVFIGEYGFPADSSGAADQDAFSCDVMKTALKWGCPFALYWEFYNNEILSDGTQRGFWMIDDHGAKQPVYFTHQRYYEKARAFAHDFEAKTGRPPDAGVFDREALRILESTRAMNHP